MSRFNTNSLTKGWKGTTEFGDVTPVIFLSQFLFLTNEWLITLLTGDTEHAAELLITAWGILLHSLLSILWRYTPMGDPSYGHANHAGWPRVPHISWLARTMFAVRLSVCTWLQTRLAWHTGVDMVQRLCTTRSIFRCSISVQHVIVMFFPTTTA